MTLAVAGDAPEEHLCLTLPRHARKFIHCGDQEVGQQAIDFFITVFHFDLMDFSWRKFRLPIPQREFRFQAPHHHGPPLRFSGQHTTRKALIVQGRK